MQETKKYLGIMIESLEKKNGVLERILEKNEAQRECIKDKNYDQVDWDAFNLIMAEKDTCIEQINSIDDGFESIYNKTRDVIINNRELFRTEIGRMQDLITSITDKSVAIQAGEERNRQLIETIIRNSKSEIKKSKVNLKVASGYYKTMSNMNIAPAATKVDKKN